MWGTVRKNKIDPDTTNIDSYEYVWVKFTWWLELERLFGFSDETQKPCPKGKKSTYHTKNVRWCRFGIIGRLPMFVVSGIPLLPEIVQRVRPAWHRYYVSIPELGARNQQKKRKFQWPLRSQHQLLPVMIAETKRDQDALVTSSRRAYRILECSRWRKLSVVSTMRVDYVSSQYWDGYSATKRSLPPWCFINSTRNAQNRNTKVICMTVRLCLPH